MTGHVRKGFENQTVVVALDHILPTHPVSQDILKTAKFRSIQASIRKIGLIEPLAVHPEKPGKKATYYILLDGHLRLEALRRLGIQEAVCLIATDDEGFTYNRRISRLSAVQEHKMILNAIEKGVAPAEIAEALAVDVERIQQRQRMLDGIAPEVAELLKDRMVSAAVFPILRKMKPLRQIEAAEIMVSANRFTVSYAKVLLAATRAEFLIDSDKPKKLDGASVEDIARMEREMEKLHRNYRSVEESLGETMLTLVVARGYVSKLFRNENVAGYLDRHHPELAVEMRGIIEAVGSDARTLDR